MADEDFKISADFSEAIKEFDKFAAVNTRLNNSMGSTLKIFPAYRRSSEESVRVIREMSKGTTKLTVEVLDLTKGYYELNKVTNRSRTEMGRIITDRVQIIKGIEAETKALKALQAQRQALNSSASASFGKGSWRGRSRPGDPSVFGMEADPNWEQQIASASRERVAAVMRAATLRAQAFEAASRQAAANRLAYSNPTSPDFGPQLPPGYKTPGQQKYEDFMRQKLARQFNFAASNPLSGAPVYGPQNNPNPAQPIQGAFSGISHFIGRGAEIFALYHSIRLVTGAFENSTEAAKKLMQQITEIRTITQGTGVTFDQFKDQILAVSNAFGFAAEDVAEGTYQAISNQVVSAGNSMAFMSEEAKFARISQSTLTEAVNLTSSALTSYGLDASHAAEVNAILFKTIELGRLRASDLANSLGTVTVIAAELGVSLEEVSAALAVMTVNGIKPANAMTYLRSLMTSLAKPSAELSEYLKSIGVESGQAAVQTLSFAGILKKLTTETDGNIERMAELTPNIRGLQAAMSLAGKSSSMFGEDLNKISNAIESSKIAGLEVMNSTSLKLDQNIQRLRNHFINLWVDGFESATDAVGKLKLLEFGANTLLAVMTALASRFALTRVELLYNSIQAHGFKDALFGVKVAADGTRVSLLSLSNVGGLVILALTEAFLLFRSAAEQARQETELLLSEGFTKLNAAINSDIAPAVDDINKRFMGLQETIRLQKESMVPAEQAMRTYAKSTKDNVVKAISDVIELTKESITEFKRQQSEIETAIEASAKRQQDLRAKLAGDDLERRLGGLGAEEKKRALQVEYELAKSAAEQMAKLGTKYSSEKAQKDAARAFDIAKQISALQDEGIARDKSAIQLRAEADMDRKARRFAEIKHLEEIGITDVEQQKEKRKLLEEEEDLKSVIAAEEEKRLRQTFNSQGKYESATKTIRDAQKLQIEVEQISIEAGEKEKAYLQQQILMREKSVDALKEQEKVWKGIAENSKDASAAMALVVGQLEKIKIFGSQEDLAAKFKAAVDVVKKFEVIQTAQDAAEQRRRDLQKSRELQIAVSQAEPGAITKRLQDTIPVLKGLSEIEPDPPLGTFLNNDDEILLQDFAILKSQIARKMANYDKLMREGKVTEAVLSLQLDKDQLGVLGELGTDKFSGKLFKGKDVERFKGFVEQLTGDKITSITDSPGYVPVTPTQKAFAKFRQGTRGGDVQFTEEEFQLLKNSTKELTQKFTEQNIDLETLNRMFKVTATTLETGLAPAIQSIVDEMVAQAQRMKSLGIDITNNPSKAELKQDADSLLENADKKAGGGYARRPGIHGRGEMVINTGSTNKYRSLLEQLNNGDESFMIGQQGGRTGGYTSGQFLNKFGSIYLDGKLIPFHGDEGGLLYSGLRGRLFSEAVKYGGSTMDAINQGRTISGMQYGSPWANSRQDYRTKAVSFGDINLKGDLGDRAGIAATVDTLMVEIRRRLSRQLGSL